MNFADPEFIAILGVVGSGGVAYGVSRATQVHIRSWLKGTSQKLDNHIEGDNKVKVDIADRLARIETKIDAMNGAAK